MEKITNSAFIYTGAHDFKTPYVKYALVSHLGDTYLSLKNNNLAHPATDKVFWKKIATEATPASVTIYSSLGSPDRVVIHFFRRIKYCSACVYRRAGGIFVDFRSRQDEYACRR